MMLLDEGGGYITSLAFTPDCATLHASHHVTGIRAWNLADRTSTRYTIPDKWKDFGNFVIVPGGRWACGYANWERHLWVERGGLAHLLLDLATGVNYPFSASHRVGQTAVTSDNSHIVTVEASTDDKERPYVPNTSHKRLYCRALTDTGPQYRWHHDNPQYIFWEQVATIGTNLFAEYENGHSSSPRPGRHLTIRRISDGELERTFDMQGQWFNQLLASPDATKLVARCGTELRVWDTTDWARPPVTVKGVQKSSMDEPAACFHPSGQYLLLANGGPSVLVFETATWKQVRKWKWDAGGVLRVVAVSPDGSLAAAGGTRGTVVVWDLDL
jgi:WD40 repeat protein